MSYTPAFSAECSVTGLVPCDGDPILRARLLGDLEEPPAGNIVRVTRDTMPELRGYIPTGWTLPSFSITNGTDTFGPFVPTVLGNDWSYDMLVNIPTGRYTVVGTPALDDLSNPQPVVGYLDIVAGVGILAGSNFGILAGSNFGILATPNQ